jgi:hypothetical protein
VAEKSYKHPKSLPLCAARYAALTKAAAPLEAKLAVITEEAKSLRAYMLDNFRKTEIDGLTSNGFKFSIVQSLVPSLKDWAKFIKFVLRKGNDDLLQRSVNTPAWRERNESGKAVPGVETFTATSLRITAAKKKK